MTRAERERLAELFRAHNGYMQRAAWGIVRDDADADDAVAAAWLIVARGLSRIGAASERAYLAEVAANEAKRIWRRRSRAAWSLDMDGRTGELLDRPGAGVPWVDMLEDQRADVPELAARREQVRELLDELRTDPPVDAARRGGAPVDEHGRAYLTRGQRQALLGRVLGLSYDELAAATGRTYTRINRNVTDGRERLRSRLGVNS